jgi:hypothetical protein
MILLTTGVIDTVINLTPALLIPVAIYLGIVIPVTIYRRHCCTGGKFAACVALINVNLGKDMTTDIFIERYLWSISLICRYTDAGALRDKKNRNVTAGITGGRW